MPFTFSNQIGIEKSLEIQALQYQGISMHDATMFIFRQEEKRSSETPEESQTNLQSHVFVLWRNVQDQSFAGQPFGAEPFGYDKEGIHLPSLWAFQDLLPGQKLD